MRLPLRFALTLVSLALASVGCAAADPETAFLARATGAWNFASLVPFEGGSVFLTDVVTIGKNRHDITANIFSDDTQKTQLARYAATGTLTVAGRSSTVLDGFDVDIRLTSATVTALVNRPQLVAGLGLEDCNLEVNQAVDVMASNCMAPLARDTTCVELDLYQIAAGSDTLAIGASETSRCTTRPTAIDTARPSYSRK